jgi:tRNA dimethylallyltransferase
MLIFNVPDPLIVIVGPTAVGKTELSIRLGEAIGGEIVSADSRLFYRGMDIGTAKPSPDELARVPHHLIDVAEPDEIWSLAVFRSAAEEAISDIHSRGKVPMLVGGTGQYIRAVIEGWNLPKQPPDFRLRKILENWANTIGPFEIHRLLSIIDPVAGKIIDPKNVRRTIRALEVIFHTGHRFSEQRQTRACPYCVLTLGLIRPRVELYQRIDERIEAMIASGFIEEVKGLLLLGYSPDLPTLSAIGYREMIAYIQGRMTMEEAIIQMKKLSRIFVRRQANWFKENDPTIHWFTVTDTILEEVKAFLDSGHGWRIPGLP